MTMSDKFNRVKRGYDPSEVDPYIDTIEEVLKSYKDKDAAIKNALINAQIAADNIIKNAEIEAGRIKDRAIQFLNELSSSVTIQRNMVKGFQEEYTRIVQKYIQTLNDTDIMAVHAKIDELEGFIQKLRPQADKPPSSLDPSNDDGILP